MPHKLILRKKIKWVVLNIFTHLEIELFRDPQLIAIIAPPNRILNLTLVGVFQTKQEFSPITA